MKDQVIEEAKRHIGRLARYAIVSECGVCGVSFEACGHRWIMQWERGTGRMWIQYHWDEVGPVAETLVELTREEVKEWP